MVIKCLIIIDTVIALTLTLHSLLYALCQNKINYAIDKADLTYCYRVFFPTEKKYTLFSAIDKDFSKIDHILGNKKKSLKTQKN